ncbi:MAG: AAA family ATPase [Bacteroidales bacterium]|nr:AAA family ATPase [Bacteroidales bacterium]MDD2322407.1 AAA family ATPase [Bacteroidales bacterium]MDD3961014.1 AAA family ATPase [Bacteroidales bacterium]MDY0284601.1 AAA family ATPase [Bacteroidales bacterium]
MDLKQYADFIKEMQNTLAFTPTQGQQLLIKRLASFALNTTRGQVFILSGYAGTGKTAMVSALVKCSPVIHQRTILLAPTGRAAKILANYSSQQAFTIHKYIYFAGSTPEGNIKLSRAINKNKNTLFIIDEASMIPGYTAQSSKNTLTGMNILDDIMEFVFSGENCKLLLLGDSAQLPPVGFSISPALDAAHLRARYPYYFHFHELTEVVRQEQESGILAHATEVRKRINTENFNLPLFDGHRFPDFIPINGYDLQDALESAYSSSDNEDAVIITRSNKRANLFNQEIRKRILFREGEINAGDRLMVVKNNYFWLPKEAKTPFIANGDTLEVLRVKSIEPHYGFRFADVDIHFPDYPDEQQMEVKILIDTLTTEAPSLTREQTLRLWNAVLEDYSDISSAKEKMQLARNNPWFNALQVKFAYAITCHKTQGGQWDTVFIDPGYRKEPPDKEWFRWLYTAITRGIKKAAMVNFRDEFWK